MHYRKLKNLENFLEEIDYLKAAASLLEQVYIHCDRSGKIPDEVRYKLETFFGYDDSE